MKEYEAEFDLCPFCGYIKDTPAKSRNHLEPGTEIANRYIIGKSLGQGGFGITYIAWDNKIQKTVTIKEFFPNALSTRGSGEVSVSCFNDRAEAHFKEGMKKMLDEGRRLSKFTDNENIVDVYDFFEENNTSYIVMEYLSGKDLKQFLEEKGGKLDPEEAVKIILPILNALSDMHKAQLIHRDVAPDNIFLCDNGKIKLLDFGSARLAVDENEKSLSIMLKHGFAPKEQYSSRSNQGPWTDVYAVCATLYKMITGEVPPDSIDRKSDSLKPLSAFGINGYAALEEVITKGLEVEAEDRYQDVKTLKKELVLGLEKKNSIITKKESDNPAKTNNTNGKKNSKKIIIAAVAVIVLVAGLVSGTVFTNKFKKNKTDTSTESSTSTTSTATNSSTSTTLEATTEISTTEDISAQQQKLKEIKEKAVKAYEKELSELSDYLSSVYITDINQDGIPEVIYRLLSGQGAMTYTEKHGLSTVDFSGHSSMNPEIYISNENCIYFRDDGHNQGTAWYHHAEFYSINETGFVKTHEIDGEEWEDFDWNNEELFDAIDKKYEKKFDDEINKIRSGKIFYVYSDKAVTQNPETYLGQNLGITFQTEPSKEQDVSESQILDSGKCGQNLTWVLYKNGELVISGEGNMYDFHSDGDEDMVPPWMLNHHDKIKSVRIESGVKRIGNDAFWNIPNLEKVYLSDTVSVRSHVFASPITEIIVDPNNPNYSTDDKGVLFNKDKTELVYFPMGKTGNYIIPNTVESIDIYAFCSSSITSVTIPNSVTDITSCSFVNSNIENITIPNSVINIENDAFSGCDNLTDVYYTGNILQWYTISIAENNECLTNATIHYNS